MSSQYYVYILTNFTNTVLYTGITNNIERRLAEHRVSKNSFSGKYKTTKLVYIEAFNSPEEAIIAEKSIKGWTRLKKNKLISSQNPEWKDLAQDCSHPEQREGSSNFNGLKILRSTQND